MAAGQQRYYYYYYNRVIGTGRIFNFVPIITRMGFCGFTYGVTDGHRVFATGPVRPSAFSSARNFSACGFAAVIRTNSPQKTMENKIHEPNKFDFTFQFRRFSPTVDAEIAGFSDLPEPTVHTPLPSEKIQHKLLSPSIRVRSMISPWVRFGSNFRG